MMDCRECNELLPLYLDTSLSPEEMQAIKQHLDVCRPCHEEFGKLSDTLELVRKLEKVDPPADFHARFMLRFNQECPPKKNWNWWGTLSLGTVAAVAMVLLVVVLYHPVNDLEILEPRLSDQAPADTNQPVSTQQATRVPAPSKDLEEGIPIPSNKKQDQYIVPPKNHQRKPNVPQQPLIMPIQHHGPRPYRPIPDDQERLEKPSQLNHYQDEWSGSKSNVRVPRNQVVRSEAALRKLWQSAEIKSVPRPQVDWRRQMVGAIFLGDQPGQGHEILLQEIQRTTEGQTVKYHVEPPETITGASSRPFLIFILPYSRQPVQFQPE